MALGAKGGGKAFAFRHSSVQQRLYVRPSDAARRHSLLSVRCRSVTYAPTIVSPVEDAHEEAPEFPCTELLQPWLTHVRGHESSLTAGILAEDVAGGPKLFVSASMDKTVAAWRIKPAEDPSAAPTVEVQKIMAPGAPLFSLVKAPSPSSSSGSGGGAAKEGKGEGGKPVPLLLYCGNAAKEVVAWEPFNPKFQETKLGDHTGWVRSLAVSGKFLFSCGCNYMRQWDTTYAVPKEVNKIKLFTGDILALAAGTKRVFTGCADGSVRSWMIVDKQTGALEERASQPNAHEGRTMCLLLDKEKGRLFSAGSDGVIKVWDKETMELLGEAVAAHDGEKIHCMAMGPGGILFTGGDDRMIRAWDPSSLLLSPVLQQAEGCALQPHHGASVRMLAGGPGCLVSGDSEGFVSFWRYGPAVQRAVEAEARAAAEAAKAALALVQLQAAAAEGVPTDMDMIFTDMSSILRTLEAPLEDETLSVVHASLEEDEVAAILREEHDEAVPEVLFEDVPTDAPVLDAAAATAATAVAHAVAAGVVSPDLSLAAMEDETVAAGMLGSTQVAGAAMEGATVVAQATGVADRALETAAATAVVGAAAAAFLRELDPAPVPEPLILDPPPADAEEEEEEEPVASVEAAHEGGAQGTVAAGTPDAMGARAFAEAALAGAALAEAALAGAALAGVAIGDNPPPVSTAEVVVILDPAAVAQAQGAALEEAVEGASRAQVPVLEEAQVLASALEAKAQAEAEEEIAALLGTAPAADPGPKVAVLVQEDVPEEVAAQEEGAQVAAGWEEGAAVAHAEAHMHEAAEADHHAEAAQEQEQAPQQEDLAAATDEGPQHGDGEAGEADNGGAQGDGDD